MEKERRMSGETGGQQDKIKAKKWHGWVIEKGQTGELGKGIVEINCPKLVAPVLHPELPFISVWY